MKTRILKSIIIMMVAFVSQAVNAQENKQVKKLDRNGNVTEVTYTDGSTTSFTKTTSDQVSYADKVAVINGQKRAYKTAHRNLAGELRHCVSLTPVIGGIYAIDDHEFQPVAGIKGTYETCHCLFEVEVSGSFMEYTETASSAGHHYAVLAPYVGAGVKLWSSKLGDSYVASGGSMGYCYQRTDVPSADVFSDNYGFAYKGWLRCVFALNRMMAIFGEAGYNGLPKVRHLEVQDHQDFKHGGPYIQVGLNFRFR